LGIIKSTVLNAKQGVITEERFQKMTTFQWIFHYKEIMKYKQAEFNNEDNKFKAECSVLKSAVTALCDQIEIMGVVINPEAGKRYMEIKQLNEAKKEIKEEDFAEEWKNLKEVIPQRLMAKTTWDDSSKVMVKKEKKRKPSISFNLKGGE
jgi:hypothetical protein